MIFPRHWTDIIDHKHRDKHTCTTFFVSRLPITQAPHTYVHLATRFPFSSQYFSHTNFFPFCWKHNLKNTFLIDWFSASYRWIWNCQFLPAGKRHLLQKNRINKLLLRINTHGKNTTLSFPLDLWRNSHSQQSALWSKRSLCIYRFQTKQICKCKQ